MLAIGNSLNQHATFGYRDDLFNGKKLIHVNISEIEIDKVYKADAAIVADAKPAVEALHAALEPKVKERPRAKVDGRDYEARRIPHIVGDIHPGQLAQAIGRMLPPGGIVLADAGAHLAWMGYYIELEEGQNFRKPGGFGPMAGHVNGAIGLKLAHPDRAVVVGCGDGCYNLSGFELMTAVEHNIPIVWIIFNDGEFKLIKAYQLMAYGESGLVEFQNPDYAAYARACGASGYRVETSRGIRGRLRRGACAKSTCPDRRQDHPLGNSQLQLIAGGQARWDIRSDRAALARSLKRRPIHGKDGPDARMA